MGPAGATFFSFVAALCFFLLELFVYQTVSWKSALQPLIVAGELMPNTVLQSNGSQLIQSYIALRRCFNPLDGCWLELLHDVVP